MDSLINWKTSINSGAPFYIECRFITKNNVYKYLYIHMIPHRNRDGVCLRWIGTATPLIKEYDLISNVDPQHTTEHIRDAVEEIISITAHELSTPLTILLGQAKILQQRMEAAQAQPQNQHTIDIIVEQSQRLSRLLHMLMDVTRIDRGQLYMNMIVLDIGTFVWHIVDMLQSVFAHHILRVNVTNEPLWVRGDEVGLEQVLHNIIQNAVKYSPIGSEVVINVTSDDEYAHIIVRDQGMGIPRNVQPYLFERFFRAHEHNKYAQPGLGLGLYISKSIVELHQGRIELASAVGEGTMVTVSLPRYVE
nr:PAS domain-containing sensor histidine kinase [Oscillochloris trichoides]